MSKERVTLYEALQGFLGVLHAEGCRVIDEWPPETPVTVAFGPCEARMTLAAIKRLDRAFMQAYEAKAQRASRKRRGAML